MHNRENFGAMLKSIIGNLKSIIGSGLLLLTCCRNKSNIAGKLNLLCF